jgi:quercetin dioxygenase-like cupin family protein
MANASGGTMVPPSLDIKEYRLIVTGHDGKGQSVFLSDRTAPHVMTVQQTPTYAVTDLWKALSLPADNSPATEADPCSVPFVVAPPSGGCVFRVVQFPPDRDWESKVAAMGGVAPVDETATLAAGRAARHGQTHRTRSLDFAIVLSGEIWAIMDVGEKKMTAGDMLVQRGTNHAWANRSNDPCNVAFILIDAKALGGSAAT